MLEKKDSYKRSSAEDISDFEFLNYQNDHFNFGEQTISNSEKSKLRPEDRKFLHELKFGDARLRFE